MSGVLDDAPTIVVSQFEKSVEERKRRAKEWQASDAGKAAARARHLRYKQEAVDHYGGRCACCGETSLVFLTFDHVEGGGNEHRRDNKISMIVPWLRSHGYPEGFQVLCWNCNAAKHMLGACPHGTMVIDDGGALC